MSCFHSSGLSLPEQSVILSLYSSHDILLKISRHLRHMHSESKHKRKQREKKRKKKNNMTR